MGQRREELGNGKVPTWATVLYPLLQPGREKEYILQWSWAPGEE